MLAHSNKRLLIFTHRLLTHCRHVQLQACASRPSFLLHPTLLVSLAALVIPPTRAHPSTLKSSRLVLPLLFGALVPGAHASENPENDTLGPAQVELDAHDCVTNFDPTTDYFSPEHRAMLESSGLVTSTVTFANAFSIEYFHTFKIVRHLSTSKVYV